MPHPFWKTPLTHADVCDQTKARYVCDVNINPAEKHLFITWTPYPAKSPSEKTGKHSGVQNKLWDYQRGEMPHLHETMSPPRAPSTKLQAGLTVEGPRSSPRTGSLLTKTSLPPAAGLSCTKQDLFGFIFELCPYRAAFASSFALDFKEPKEMKVKYSKGKLNSKGEFFSPSKMNLVGVKTKQAT